MGIGSWGYSPIAHSLQPLAYMIHPEKRVRVALLIGLFSTVVLTAVVIAWRFWQFDTAQSQQRIVSSQDFLIAAGFISMALLSGVVITIVLVRRAAHESRVPIEHVANTLQRNLDEPLRISSQGDSELKIIISAFNELHARVKAHDQRLAEQRDDLEQERLRDEALISITRQLGSSLELEPLLTSFVRLLAEQFDLALAAVGMLEPNGITIRHGVTRSSNDIPQPLSTLWLPLTTGIASEAIHHRQAVLRSDPPFDTTLPVPGRVGSQLALPLFITGHVVGTLLVQTSEPINARIMQRIIDVADHLSAAMANAQLYSAARERATSLTAINDLARSISSTLDMQTILDTALQQIRQLIPYDQASVTLTKDDQPDELMVVAATDAYKGSLETGVTFKKSEFPQLKTAFEARHPVYIAQHKPETAMLPPFDQRVQSLLIQPLATSDARLGMVNLASRSSNAFTDAHITALGGLSHFLSTAIINGRLFTQRNSAYQALESSQKQLVFAAKLRAVGELAGGVTHDFNNLLAGILGNVQLLMLDITHKEHLETLRVIEKAAKDGAQTVKRIQGFARNDLDYPEGPVELDALARDAIDLTRPRWRNMAHERGVHVELQTELKPIAATRGHAAELREVVTNLLINAVDAMPKGGILRVATGQKGGEVYVSVSDTGTGMSDAVRERIFDPFFSTKAEKGNGLGLAVSAAIINRHGGRIDVHSKEGRGTSFTVWLPILEVDLDEVMSQDAVIPDIRGRILVVEDEDLVRLALSRMLSAWGHKVTVAKSGREGVALFRPGSFDIVISDLAMPDMQGWEVLRQVREQQENIHTILISGWAQTIDPAEARLRGADLVVAKPFEQLTLRRTIAHLLEGTLDMTPRVIV